MQIERLSADIKLKHKPAEGTQAYNLMVQALQEEIEKKQAILFELHTLDVKTQFIRDWNSHTKNVTIYDLEARG